MDASIRLAATTPEANKKSDWDISQWGRGRSDRLRASRDVFGCFAPGEVNQKVFDGGAEHPVKRSEVGLSTAARRRARSPLRSGLAALAPRNA
jgi:hypothetical protein